MYNGHPSSQVTAEFGALKESIDLAHSGIVTRGVLVDGPHLRGVDWIESGDGIGLDDIAAAEDRCGFTIEPGVYLPAFGVRSEIDLYVGPAGLEITTPVQREVVMIG